MNYITYRKQIVRLVVFLFIGTLMVVLCCYFTLILGRNLERKQLHDEYLSEPLPQSTVNDLCVRNLVPITVVDCTSSNIIIRRRSIPEIVEANLAKGDTFDQVETTFGQYKEYCIDDNVESLRCGYCFEEGPGASNIVIYFDKNNKLIINIIYPIK